MNRALIPVLAATLVAATADPVAAQRDRPEAIYRAPSDQTVFVTFEESFGTQGGQVVYVNNRSSVAIVVYSASLRECENVKQSCTPVRLNMRVRPDGRAIILRVNAKDPNQGFRYSASFGYRADSAQIRALEALASAGGAPGAQAQSRLDAQAAATADRSMTDAERSDRLAAAARASMSAADIWLDEDGIETLGDRIRGLRVEPESLVVRVDRALLLRDVKVMAVDSVGRLLGRVGSGMRWSYSGAGIVMNRADTILALNPGRAVVKFEMMLPGRALSTTMPIVVRPDSTP